MEFKTVEEINSFLNDNGIFLVEIKGGFELVKKTGVNPHNYQRFSIDEEGSIARFIINNTFNPYIEFKNNNVRVFATRINLDIVNDYLKEKEKIDKMQNLHDELIDCKYISVGNQCFQLNHEGKLGLWLIDQELVINNEIKEFHENIKTIEQALMFKDSTNQYKQSYDSELDKFAEIAICDFTRY